MPPVCQSGGRVTRSVLISLQLLQLVLLYSMRCSRLTVDTAFLPFALPCVYISGAVG